MNPGRVIVFLLLVFSCACVSQKKLIYFQGAVPPLQADSIYKIRIYPGDLLAVDVFTIYSDAYPFLHSPNDKNGLDNRSPYEKGYLVNEKGEIRLPLVDSIELSGLTIEEASHKIEQKFREYLKDAIVTVKKLNFKVTVLGEVNRPGTYQVLNETATLPEVLGMAGDLNQFADRKQLRIIREENGMRSDFFLDLTSAGSLSASAYYLHPNDIIYVQPVKRRAFLNVTPSVTLFTSLITTTLVVITFIITTSK